MDLAATALDAERHKFGNCTRLDTQWLIPSHTRTWTTALGKSTLLEVANSGTDRIYKKNYSWKAASPSLATTNQVRSRQPFRKVERNIPTPTKPIVKSC